MHFVLGNILTVICVSYLHISTVRLYNAFHFGCSGKYRKIHKLKCINYYNSEKQTTQKTAKQNYRGSQVQSPFTTLGQERDGLIPPLCTTHAEKKPRRDQLAVTLCLSVDRVAEDEFVLLCE